jgi:predicted DNA-binding transcriptional regulator YafY
MAKKRRLRPSDAARAVTAERAARLHRLLTLLASGSQTRDGLRRQLKMDVRSFYRDLELLRTAGIMVPLRQGHYSLSVNAEAAYRQLPFPDPHLTLGEAVQLARGSSPAHRKLKKLISQIVTTKRRS